MKQGVSTIAGFTIAPLIPAFLATIGAIPEVGYSIIYLGVWAIYFYMCSTIITLMLGVPAYFIGRWLRLVRWWSASIVGFIIGALAYLIIQWLLLVYSYATAPLNVATGLFGVYGTWRLFWICLLADLVARALGHDVIAVFGNYIIPLSLERES
jgi:hypothetical protein